MIKMINATFGNEMWIAENRVEEYLAAGHKLAADSSPEVKKEKKTVKKPKGKQKE